MMIMIIFLLFIGDTGNFDLTYTGFYPQYAVLKLWLPFFVLFCFFSGGKDSCYNMMQCVQHGHVIVALANLKPSDGGRDISSMWYGCTIAFFEKWVDLAKTTQLQLWKSMQKRLNVTFSSWFAILLFLVKLVQICTFHCRSHRIVIA